MSLLSVMIATLPASVEAAEVPVKKTKARNSAGRDSDSLNEPLIRKLRESTGASFTTRALRGIVANDSTAARVCRGLIKRGLVKVERNSVRGEGRKKLHKYTWVEQDEQA